MRNAGDVTLDAIRDSLEQGIFVDKYKVFCRGIATSDSLTQNNNSFRDEHLVGNGFFLMLDFDSDSHHIHLSKYLNTGILEKAQGLIFEKVMVVAPSTVTEDKTKNEIPHYFTIKDDGALEEVNESFISTMANI